MLKTTSTKKMDLAGNQAISKEEFKTLKPENLLGHSITIPSRICSLEIVPLSLTFSEAKSVRDRQCDTVTDRVPINLSDVYIFCDNFLDDRDNSDFDDREGGRWDALKLVLIGIMAAVCKNNHNQSPRIAAKNCIGMVSDRGEGGQ